MTGDLGCGVFVEASLDVVGDGGGVPVATEAAAMAAGAAAGAAGAAVGGTKAP